MWLTMILIDDCRAICRVNTAALDDDFVGIKLEANKVRVSFPNGYRFLDTDGEYRRDIKNLCDILVDFKSKVMLDVDNKSSTSTLAFPFAEYRTVLCEYEMLKTYIPCSVDPNYQNAVSYCVNEAWEKIGWLYKTRKPALTLATPDLKKYKYIFRVWFSKETNIQIKSCVQAMYTMVDYTEKQSMQPDFVFGTNHFELLWKSLISMMFDAKPANKVLPSAKWKLNTGYQREYSDDSQAAIMLYNGKYYLLDAVFCKYGHSGKPEHLPQSDSVSKQITFGEWIAKNSEVCDKNLFSCFIMPFNRKDNLFKVDEFVSNVGESVIWKNMGAAEFHCENVAHIQGVVMDVRQVMYSLRPMPESDKKLLAECVETGLNAASRN